jgi:hypothetical protein
MFGFRFNRWKPGDPLAAKKLNEPLPAIENAMKWRSAGGLDIVSTQSGTMIAMISAVPIWAKLTSVSGSSYAWTEQWATGSGGWTNGSMSGTTSSDPAYNSVSGVTLTLPLVVLMSRTNAGKWVFSAGSC